MISSKGLKLMCIVGIGFAVGATAARAAGSRSALVTHRPTLGATLFNPFSLTRLAKADAGEVGPPFVPPGQIRVPYKPHSRSPYRPHPRMAI